jgi:NAD-dependent deacetylase
MNDDRRLASAASAVRRSRFCIALTGAGVSVESGLPDFRSPGGLWDRYDVADYATLDAFIRNPEKVWMFVRELLDNYGQVQPNPGHRALAELETAGRLRAVITQNIDGLHQAAGSRRVVEFHGSLRRLVCLDCGRTCPSGEPSVRTAAAPRCTCGRILKPDFVFFGEMIPEAALAESFALARRCDVLIVAGTSAEVAPASMIPYAAKAAGATVVELNLRPTGLTGSVTDHFIAGPFGTTMVELLRRITG